MELDTLSGATRHSPLGSIENPVLDCDMTPDEAIRANPYFIPCPPAILAVQVLQSAVYRHVDGTFHRGQYVAHRDIAPDLVLLFDLCLSIGFPFEMMRPVAHPSIDFDDARSMELNNTSVHNWRPKTDIEPSLVVLPEGLVEVRLEHISRHGFGDAPDLNPRFNPQFSSNGRIYPPDGSYDPQRPGTIVAGGPVHRLMKELGYVHGGTDWKDPVDHMHFQKPQQFPPELFPIIAKLQIKRPAA